MKSITMRVWPQTKKKIYELSVPPQVKVSDAPLIDWLIDELIRLRKEQATNGNQPNQPVN